MQVLHLWWAFFLYLFHLPPALFTISFYFIILCGHSGISLALISFLQLLHKFFLSFLSLCVYIFPDSINIFPINGSSMAIAVELRPSSCISDPTCPEYSATFPSPPPAKLCIFPPTSLPRPFRSLVLASLTCKKVLHDSSCGFNVCYPSSFHCSYLL